MQLPRRRGPPPSTRCYVPSLLRGRGQSGKNKGPVRVIRMAICSAVVTYKLRALPPGFLNLPITCLNHTAMAQLCLQPVSMASCGLNALARTVPNARPRSKAARNSCGVSVRCSGANSAGSSEDGETSPKPQFSETVTRLACGFCAALTVASALPSLANTKPARLPPLSTDPARCERAYDGNTIGQANGVSNIVLDLRSCDYTNDVTNLKGKTLSSALMAAAKFDGADMSEVVMSKAYAVGASFRGTNFTNAVVDRVAFDNSDMRGVKFINTVLSGSTFDGANLEDASFEDALIGYVDIKNLCRNPTLSDTNKDDLGCK